MPTPFWAALASLLGLVLWLITRRQPRTLLRSTDTAAVAALNRAQIELVSQVAAVEPPSNPTAATSPERGEAEAELLPLPRTAFQQRAFLRQLSHWGMGGPEQRLRAVRAAGRWRHPAVLPLLRRGLRDGDPRVMAAAAAAIAPYRGQAKPAASGGAPLPGGAFQPGGAIQPGGAPPRRVSRTR